MNRRINKGELKPKELDGLPEDMAARIFMLGDLEKVVHRIMASMLAFELEIRLSITELKARTAKISANDQGRPNARPAAREVARNRRRKRAPVS